MRPLALLFKISKIQIITIAFLCTTSSVGYSISSSCIKSESQLKEIIEPYKIRYKNAVDCVSQVENKIPCSDFSEQLKKSKEEHLQLIALFEETKCIDFLILGLNEYDLYYYHSARSLSDYRSITTEYDKVSTLAQQSLQNIGDTVIYKEKKTKTEKLLRAISEDLDNERARVSTILRKYKPGLGVGIGLVIVGAGLLAGGASLFALDGTTAAPLGCPIDGRDSACVRQVNSGVAGVLTGAGAALLLGGLGETIGFRVWLGRQQTPAPPPKPDDSKPNDSKPNDAQPGELTTPATAPAAPALDSAPAGSP